MSVQDKINSDYYKTKLEYPSREKFQITEVVETKRLGKQTVHGFDKQGYDAARLACRADKNRLQEEFKADAFEELGITNNPKAELLFSKAWELGHSYGLSEVWIYLQDLVELIQ